MNQQRHLFPLPRPISFTLTEAQQGVLDWVAMNEGKVAAWPIRLYSKKTLRIVIHKGLVKLVGHSPSRYALTEVGRIVRQERPRRFGFGTTIFFEDEAPGAKDEE